MQHTLEDTRNLIDRLDKWLRENRPDFYAELLPGLDDAQLAEFEATVGLPLPEDFKLFYKWKNGQPHTSHNELFHVWILMSVKNIIDTCQMMNELLEGGDFHKNNWWNVRWLPFLERCTGDHWCLDFEGSFGGKPGQIIEFWHDWDSRDILCPDFYKWLEELVLYFERGLYSEEDSDLELWDYMAANIPGYPINNSVGYSQ